MVSEESVDFPPLLFPPVVPPEVCLIGRDVTGKWQSGILSHADWTIDGRKATLGSGKDVEWPMPIDSTREGVVRVRFLTESAPSQVEIRQFGDPGHGKLLIDNTVRVMNWFNPRLRQSDGHRFAEVMRYGWEPEPPGWDLFFPISPLVDIAYINVWATWRHQVFITDSYSVNWRVSARRTQLASPGPEYVSAGTN